MQRTILAAGTIVIAITAQAQLAPTTEAPLYQHMLEVNKEWKVMDPDMPDGARLVRFTDEAERIATHLHRVAAYQRAHTPEGLPAPALAERLSLLSALDTYADRGVFPRNHVLPVRNPVFIDPHGTACAVGQLMIVSGNDGLAKRIQDEMNLAYVHDMKREDVFAWAGDHGFTEDELAWIQPGYPPSIPWYTLGNGTNGTVQELLRLQNGDLLVAGDFSLAGGTYATRVARWNGSSFQPMGAGLEGVITSAIEFNGEIYVGGSFGGGSTDLARWTGSSWVMTAVFLSKFAYINALHVHNGELHAAGASSGFSGISYGVRRLVNGDWTDVGQQLNGEVRALESFDGGLVCGGTFTGNYFSQDTTLRHVAILNGGTWEELSGGLDGTVRDLLWHNGYLYAAGDLVAEVATYFGLARITVVPGTWEPQLPNLELAFFSPLDGLVGINSMLPDPDGNGIHLGGDFYCAVGMDQGYGLATYHGSPDNITVLGEFMGPVNDLELLGTSELVAGGASEARLNIASTDLTLGVPAREGASILTVWPNPTTDHVRVEGLPGTITRIDLMDAAGRLVKRLTNVPATSAIDVRDLPAGHYTALVLADNKLLSAPFIKR